MKHLVLALCTLALTATAQKDLRDTVILKKGKPVRGRVVTRFDPKEILIAQGGKRVRVARKKLKSMATVQDQLRTFLKQHRKLKGDDIKGHWILAQWAKDHELPAMARVQATWILAEKDGHAGAHQLLDHKRSKKHGWLWPRGSKWQSRSRFLETTAKMGTPFVLRSEHFAITTDAGLARTVLALIDLEHFYDWFFLEFGEALQLHESLKPMELQVWNSEDAFPGWVGARLPYYVPSPHSDRAYSFYRGVDKTPVDLYVLGTQLLLYRSLALNTSVSGPMDRICAWLELGFGQWIQSQWYGEAGKHETDYPRFEPYRAQTTLLARKYKLPNLLHLSIRDHFYGAAFHNRQGVHWDSVHTFTAFLMDERVDPKNRDRLLRYLYLALRKGKGDSSQAFDKAMGQKIESFEKPWRNWLIKHAK